MLNVFECVTQQHDIGLVLIAAVVCALGSSALFILLKRAFDSVERRRKQWIAVAACAAGIGVWSTHFISMLAYRGGLPLAFDGTITTLSAAIAVGFFWAAFSQLDQDGGLGRSILAGFLAAGGVASMHFMGMAAIIAPAAIEYAPLQIAAAVLVAGILHSAAFVLFFAAKGWGRIVFPAGATILAIVLLHFTAMTATTLIPEPSTIPVAANGSHSWLIAAVVGATAGLLLIVLIGAIIDRLLTDLQGLVEATLEGLIIVRGREILEANVRACGMIGAPQAEVLGTDPDDWFDTLDGGSVLGGRTSPAEARIRGSAIADQIIEIVSHTIEYRGRRCQVLAIRDLTDRKRAQRAVEHLAAHDALTGLMNRAAFDQRLAQVTANARDRHGYALIAVDLDRFKAVNDVFGHAAGDQVLRRVASLLQASINEGDCVARIGGDEFAILHRSLDAGSGAQRLTARILDGFAAEMDPLRDPTAVGVSLGVAIFPRDGTNSETLRHNADIALYRAKQEGRGIAYFFDEEMDRAAHERRQIEHDLRHAILRSQLRLVFQPLVSTDWSTLVGYEALLRWTHPERGEIAPELFVPIAEETGAIIPIGEWVLREACCEAAGWPEHLTIAVNVSAVQFRMPNLPNIVRSALLSSGLAPHRLELEITESVLIKHREVTLAALHTIKAMGVRIVMDDFGTGYSSLSNLQSFPFDKLKIDRSFVSSMPDDQAARSILRAIVGLGKSLDLPVVAEAVETEAQRLMVMEEGCPQAQGYLFGEPQQALHLSDRWGPSIQRAG